MINFLASLLYLFIAFPLFLIFCSISWVYIFLMYGLEDANILAIDSCKSFYEVFIK